MAQCKHFRPSLQPPATTSGLSFFLGADFVDFLPEFGGMMSVSDKELVGESARRRDVHLHGMARARLLRALAGKSRSDSGGFWLFSGWKSRVSDASSVFAFIPEIN